jgi:pyruvate dehydrogenase E2 component (dihydrolipoamide acetyltransferase)
MEEGALSKWHVKEGDKVSAGDVIAEIETDKATMDVEAVDEGVIGKILVAAGSEGVKVNAPIAILLEEDESAEDIDVNALETGAQGAQQSKRDIAPPPAGELSAKRTEGVGAQTPPPSRPAASTSPPQLGEEKRVTARIFASPLARRMAEQEGLELSLLKGSGPRGRIVKRDIEKARTEGDRAAPAAEKAAPAARPAPKVAPAGLDPQLYPPESYTAVKLDMMRRVIAKRLTQSFNQEVPHFPLNMDIELDTLLAARKRINDAAPKEGEGAFKLSVNDFIIKAAAMALIEVPHANASFTDEVIILHKHADIAVAVAIEGGLITPIIWRAEQKGLKQISTEMKDLAARARARKLKPEEYQGGTFSVSNLGMYGVTSFASIVNLPHGAILSIGAGERRTVVRNEEIVIATVMTVTLTCDHRVVDGAVGAEFLGAFKRYIEEPAAMLL